MMKFHTQHRDCHAERSEASLCLLSQILRCAQDDKTGFGRENSSGAGVLCLSASGYDPCISWNPNESYCDEDKHKAPAHPHIRPLSLQDGAARIAAFGWQSSSGRRRAFPVIPLIRYY